MIEAVNIRGTQNVINGKNHTVSAELRDCSLHVFFSACIECGVRRLVYTSTYNVVFAGQEIRNGDHLEILPDHKVSKVATWHDQIYR